MPIPVSMTSRAEHRLLLLCACHVHSPAAKRDFDYLIRKNLDWDFLLPRLQSHGLMALFCHHVQGQEDGLPEDPRQVLQNEFGGKLQQRLKMLVELQQVVRFLTAEGVQVLAYKGPTLAQIAYGSVALRPFADLDLLIAPADKQKTVALLKTQGYLPYNDHLLPPDLEVKRQIRDYEMTLQPNRGLASIDLHWAVAPPYDGFPLHFETLWQRRANSELANFLPTFCREDLILCLCAHGLKHRWHRLEWIGCLLAILLRADENALQWAQIQSTAGMLKSERALRLGLLLAFDLAGMDADNLSKLRKNVPEDLHRAIAADIVVRQLARQVWKTLFEPENNANIDAFITVPALVFAIRAREGWKARWVYLSSVVRAFLMPEAQDVARRHGWLGNAKMVRLQRLVVRRLHRLLVLGRF